MAGDEGKYFSQPTTSEVREQKITGLDTTSIIIDDAGSSFVPRFIDVDNTANSAPTFLKLFNQVSVVHGSDHPTEQIKIPAQASGLVWLPDPSIGDGARKPSYATGLCVCAATLGGISGSNPASSFNMVLGYTT